MDEAFYRYWGKARRDEQQEGDEYHLLPYHISGCGRLRLLTGKTQPLQQLAADLPLNAEGAELLILEDVTGAGKTEAALILANRLMAQGKGNGLYIGLPTMATSNAMFSRLQQAYRTLFQQDAQPSLMLAHGACELNDAFRHSLWQPETQPGQTE